MRRDVFSETKLVMLILKLAEVIENIYNITFRTFITMISRIMLQKIRFFSQHYPPRFGGVQPGAAERRRCASLKPLGFIASAIADDGVTDKVLLPDGASSM